MNDGSAHQRQSHKQTPDFVRPGFNNIAPYILVKGAARLMDFLKAALEAPNAYACRNRTARSCMRRLVIGDSVIELGDANENYPARRTTVHLYVENADVTFDRALQAGATSIYPVADQHWGDRQGVCQRRVWQRVEHCDREDWTPEPGGLRSVQTFFFICAMRRG